MTNLENALIWLYVKTWGSFGDNVIKEKELWTFSADDLRTALMELAYPRKRKFQEKEKSERVKASTGLIMGKFENPVAFVEWSMKIHEDNNENLPETPKQKGPIKILKWDPGNHLILSNFLLEILMCFSIIISCICVQWYI